MTSSLSGNKIKKKKHTCRGGNEKKIQLSEQFYFGEQCDNQCSDSLLKRERFSTIPSIDRNGTGISMGVPRLPFFSFFNKSTSSLETDGGGERVFGALGTSSSSALVGDGVGSVT